MTDLKAKIDAFTEVAELAIAKLGDEDKLKKAAQDLFDAVNNTNPKDLPPEAQDAQLALQAYLPKVIENLVTDDTFDIRASRNRAYQLQIETPSLQPDLEGFEKIERDIKEAHLKLDHIHTLSFALSHIRLLSSKFDATTGQLNYQENMVDGFSSLMDYLDKIIQIDVMLQRMPSAWAEYEREEAILTRIPCATARLELISNLEYKFEENSHDQVADKIIRELEAGDSPLTVTRRIKMTPKSYGELHKSAGFFWMDRTKSARKYIDRSLLRCVETYAEKSVQQEYRRLPIASVEKMEGFLAEFADKSNGLLSYDYDQSPRMQRTASGLMVLLTEIRVIMMTPGQDNEKFQSAVRHLKQIMGEEAAYASDLPQQLDDKIAELSLDVDDYARQACFGLIKDKINTPVSNNLQKLMLRPVTPV